MSNGVTTAAPVNPLDAGNDAHSVESAAQAFTEILSQESEAPKGQSRPSGRRRREEEDDTLFPDTDMDPDTARSDEGQGSDENDPSDPILDDDGKSDDKSEDDTDDEEKDEDETDEDDDEEDDEDETDDDELDLEKEVEITVNGEVQNVKLSEVIAGYSREADYRQKTASLAEERREVVEFAQAVVEERQKYDTTLQSWLDMTEALRPADADWEALKKADPNTYIQTKEQWEAIEKKVAEAKAERETIAAKQAEDEARNYREYVKACNTKLVELVPALVNPKKAKAFSDTVFAYGKAAGYSEEELMTGAVDPRDVLTLYKAGKYDEIMRSRKAGQRPAKKTVKTSAVSPPRNVSKSTNPGAKRQLRDADRRLQRSGSVDDAANAFTAMLKS